MNGCVSCWMLVVMCVGLRELVFVWVCVWLCELTFVSGESVWMSVSGV